MPNLLFIGGSLNGQRKEVDDRKYYYSVQDNPDVNDEDHDKKEDVYELMKIMAVYGEGNGVVHMLMRHTELAHVDVIIKLLDHYHPLDQV